MGVIQRTNPSGDVVFGIQWVDEDGRRRRVSDRSWSESDAQAEMDAIERREAAGVAARSELSMADLFEAWSKDYVELNCSRAWLDDSRTQFRLRIEPMLGHRPVREVTRPMLLKMITHMKRKPVGPATINKTMTVVSGMLSHALDLAIVDKNVAAGIKRQKELPSRKPTAWPLPVVKAIASSARAHHEELHPVQRAQRGDWAGERDYTMIMLAAFTGVRQSELLGLEWGCIEGEWLRIKERVCRRTQTLGTTKSARGLRLIPILPAARELLEEWRQHCPDGPWMFPNSNLNGPMRANHFDQKVWDRARDLTGIVTVGKLHHDSRDLTFHELRHTFISTCLGARRSVWEVASWAGDRPEMIERVYGHYIPNLPDAKRLGRAFSGL